MQERDGLRFLASASRCAVIAAALICWGAPAFAQSGGSNAGSGASGAGTSSGSSTQMPVNPSDSSSGAAGTGRAFPGSNEPGDKCAYETDKAGSMDCGPTGSRTGAQSKGTTPSEGSNSNK
jgi:hypothetical protein